MNERLKMGSDLVALIVRMWVKPLDPDFDALRILDASALTSRSRTVLSILAWRKVDEARQTEPRSSSRLMQNTETER